MAKSLNNSQPEKSYWDLAAGKKVFSHPLPIEWLEEMASDESAILDVGCGYGRTCSELVERGYKNISGVDTSKRMIELAKERVPQGNFLEIDAGTLPFESESLDLVILFAVLTCIPDWDDQKRLIDQIDHVLRPGGIILMSGYPLQTDQRNLDRYVKYEPIYGDYGLFEIDEGQVLLRHHSNDWFERLFERFTILKQRRIEIVTMNGHRSTIVQMGMKKPKTDIRIDYTLLTTGFMGGL